MTLEAERYKVKQWTDVKLLEYQPRGAWNQPKLDRAVDDELRNRYAALIEKLVAIQGLATEALADPPAEIRRMGT